MPIYEYECRECGTRFERMQSFQDEPVRVCPTCGGETRRVLHPVGVIFKGSGWYVTDSRKARGKAAEGDGDKATATETKAESSAGGTETTPSAAKSSGGETKPAKSSDGDA